jgi:hypothetical protein
MYSKFDIPRGNIPYLRDRVEKLNKKAKKHNLPPLTLVEGERGTPIKCTAPDGFEFEVGTLTVELRGDFPTVDGWHLVGRLNETKSGKNIVSLVPGEDEPPKWVREFYGCQHCKVKRYRKDVFIIRKNGEYKVVGRQCLKEFFDGLSPDLLVNWAKLIDLVFKIENESSKGEASPFFPAKLATYPLEEVLIYTAAEIDVFGWVSATKAWENSNLTATKVYVQGYIVPDPSIQRRRDSLKKSAKEKGVDLFTDAVRKEVLSAIKWAQNLDTSSNTYFWNIRTIAENGYVTYRDFGMACSILPTYRRSLAQGEKGKSDYIGKVGETLTFDGVVIYVNSFPSNYGSGTSTLIKMVDGKDNVINAWVSGSALVVKGDKTKVQGVIKDHNEFRGSKETVIKYVKFGNDVEEVKKNGDRTDVIRLVDDDGYEIPF